LKKALVRCIPSIPVSTVLPIYTFQGELAFSPGNQKPEPSITIMVSWLKGRVQYRISVDLKKALVRCIPSITVSTVLPMYTFHGKLACSPGNQKH
jgi:hypothetical protein